MPRDIRELEIDGHHYQVKLIGAHVGGQILFRVGRALPGLLAGQSLSPEMLSTEDFRFVVAAFIDGTRVGVVDTKGDGRTTWVALDQSYDEHFAGRYGAWAEWLKASWEANFGPFFSAIAALARARKTVATSVRPSEPKPAGSAGASSSAPA